MHISLGVHSSDLVYVLRLDEVYSGASSVENAAIDTMEKMGCTAHCAYSFALNNHGLSISRFVSPIS